MHDPSSYVGIIIQLLGITIKLVHSLVATINCYSLPSPEVTYLLLNGGITFSRLHWNAIIDSRDCPINHRLIGYCLVL